MAISVEISLPMLFGLKVTFDDVKTIYDGLLSRIGADKSAICLGFHIINVNVAGWYGDICARFSFIPTDKAVKFSNEDRANLEQFIKKRERTELAEKSLIMLDVLKERYDSNERDTRLKGEIRDRLDRSKIVEIKNILEEFVDLAIDTKKNWLREFRNSDNTWSIRPTDIDMWEEELNRKRRDLNNLITRQQMILQCDQVSSQALFNALKPRTS